MLRPPSLGDQKAESTEDTVSAVVLSKMGEEVRVVRREVTGELAPDIPYVLGRGGEA